MEVFTNSTESAFFKTDDYIKNLHVIEINTIEDFILKYALDPMILLGAKSWIITRFDELKSGTLGINDFSDEPAIHGESINIDFVEAIKILDILNDICRLVDLNNDDITECKAAGIFSEAVHEWVDNDDTEKWTLKTWGDTRKAELLIYSDGRVSITMINHKEG